MFILGGVCIFLGIVLGIMGLMAWGAMTNQEQLNEEQQVQAEAPDTEPPN